MPDLIHFATQNCLPNYSKQVSLDYPKRGFTPFRSSFAGTYTVGQGWDVTSYQAGDLVKRVTSTWIDVYEANTAHTASDDPASDTTNWRRAGSLATPGKSSYWYNINPIVKYGHRATFRASPAGWLMEYHGFQHGLPSAPGVICRYDGNKYRSIGTLPFAVPPTNIYQWEPYSGSAPHDVDYAYGRYCILAFNVGDIVIRSQSNSPYYRFFRCKATVDYAGQPDGTGDPLSDTTHWEEYVGLRSLWQDFSRGEQPYSSPFQNHRIPKPRYRKWKETSAVYVDDVLQLTVERVYEMDALGRVQVVSDETTHSEVFELTDFPAGPSNGGTFPPANQPGTYCDWVTLNHHYHARMVSNFTISNFMWPAYGMNVSYTKTTYSSYGWALDSDWPNPPYSATNSTVNKTLPLKNIALSSTATEFEFVGIIEWWHEFDLALIAQAGWHNQQIRWFCYAILGCVYDAEGSGTAPPCDPNGQYPPGYSAGVNVVHNAEVKVIQRIELLDELTDSAWLSEAQDIINAVGYPPVQWHNRIISINADGSTSYQDGAGAPAFNALFLPWYSSDTPIGIAGEDIRLYQDVAKVASIAWWVSQRHWTVEQEVGQSPSITEYPFGCSPTSHVYTPSEVLKSAKVADIDPNQ